MIEMIISGGQTGVDRAALDIAIELGVQYGGWCPKGRIDENGTIPDKYENLREVDGDFQSEYENYSHRTIRNIHNSDGTLIIVPNVPLSMDIQDGTVLTINELRKLDKPHLLFGLSTDFHNIDSWVNENQIKILNVAGPRESTSLGIYQTSFIFLKNVFMSLLLR